MAHRRQMIAVLVFVAACLLVALGLWLLRGDAALGMAGRADGRSTFHPPDTANAPIPLAKSFECHPDAPRLEIRAAELVAEAEEQSGTLVVGRVIHRDKKTPVVGARVLQLDQYNKDQIDDWSWKPARPVTSDGDGFFTLRISKWNYQEGATNVAVLYATAPGWVFADGNQVGISGVYIKEPTDGRPIEVTITMVPAVTIRGTVRHEDGRAISGWVAVRGRGSSSGRGSMLLPVSGQFAFSVPPHETYVIDATVEGYGEVESAPVEVFSSDVTGVEILLGRFGQVAGLVVDPAGNPVPGARVYHRRVVDRSVVTDLAWRPLVDPRRQPPRATADESGNFRFGDVQPGTVELFAAAEGFAESTRVEVDLRAGEQRTGVSLRLRPVTFVAGRVVDARKAPVGGAMVELTSEEGFDSRVLNRAFHTDADGRFRIDGTAAGDTLRLVVSGPSGGRTVWKGAEVAEGDPDAEYVLGPPGGRVTVVVSVLDKVTEEPVRGLRVTGQPPPIIEDADLGLFRLKGVRVVGWRSFETLHLQADGHADHHLLLRDLEIPASTPDGEVLRRTIFMRRPGTINGRVVSGTPPRPVAGVLVVCTPPPGEDPEIATIPSALTGADGRFSLPVKRGDIYFVHPRPDSPLVGYPVKVSLFETDSFDVGDMVIDEGHRVRLRLTNGDGSPRVGARVVLERGDTSLGTNYRDALVTDDQGRVLFESLNNEATAFVLEEGHLLLTVDDPTRAPAEIEVPTGRATLAVRAGTAERPVELLTVGRRLGPGAWLAAWQKPRPNADGWRVFERLAAGQWTISTSIADEANGLLPRSVTLVEGQRVEVELGGNPAKTPHR